eukprot:7996208-Alexandrium_andersonii.AAC.1
MHRATNHEARSPAPTSVPPMISSHRPSGTLFFDPPWRSHGPEKGSDRRAAHLAHLPSNELPGRAARQDTSEAPPL